MHVCKYVHCVCYNHCLLIFSAYDLREQVKHCKINGLMYLPLFVAVIKTHNPLLQQMLYELRVMHITVFVTSILPRFQLQATWNSLRYFIYLNYVPGMWRFPGLNFCSFQGYICENLMRLKLQMFISSNLSTLAVCNW